VAAGAEGLSEAECVPSRNLEIVQRGFEAFNREGIEGIIPLIHPDFEAITPPDLASEPDTYRGPDGVRRWFRSFDEVMDQIRWDSRGFRQVGDRVVVEFTLRARGKTTGLDFGQEAVMVWELRDGKAIRLALYPTLDQALAAATAGSRT
jgi:ketosteroid isomerase-like protein